MTTISAFTCANCGHTFEPRRKDAKYCGPRCKDTAKKRRKRADPKKASRELEARRERDGIAPKAFRNLSSPASVTSKFGLVNREPAREEWDF